MFRTSLRSASGRFRSHTCASCLRAPRRHVRDRRFYSTPAREDEQNGGTDARSSVDSVDSTASSEETSKLASSSISSNGPTGDAESSKSHRKNEPSTSDGNDISKVYTRDLFKKTNSFKPPARGKRPESEEHIKSEEKKLDGKKSDGETKSEKRSSKGQLPWKKKPPVGKKPLVAGKWSQKGQQTEKAPAPKPKPSPEALETHTGSLLKEDIDFKALDYDTPPVPALSFGLDRVLFNPGVYHLRDPRSRVYNFDPELGTIMPVTEFDFNTLKAYITSSKDETLIQLARNTKKKYVGSSSSMTGVLSHFHYLLSQWRPLRQDVISRGFKDSETNFTKLVRGPSAMFLHYKDGVYAIDADKEFDSANILMNLGKSMEKQLTLPKEEFERYRRSAPNKITPEEENALPESYHYSTLGDFVMRSQLDAYDPRLPGSGMFDLKTRAVVSIRMSVLNYEQGLGYEIRNRFGPYESFEREYYDMIRAAFLKYSLQVRVGRMDGIFVAFHNIERIFGFQYVPLSEMDYALHGQSDSELGDREFQYSIKLWNEVLDRATAKYPNQSLRLHFETLSETPARMRIYVQPVTDEDIRAIQEKNKTKIERAQQQMLYPETITQEEDLSLEDDVDGSDTAVAETMDEATSVTTTETNAVVDETVNTTSENIEPQPVIDAEAESSKDTTASSPAVPSQPDSLPTEPEANKDPTASSSPAPPSSTDSPPTEINPITTLTDKIQQSRDTILKLSDRYRNILWIINRARIRPTLFGMELNIENIVNGRAVKRPISLKPHHSWEVSYSIKEFKIGTVQLYQQFDSMRSRRREALTFEKKENGSSNRFFLNLRKLAMQGKKYREEQDRIDREKGIVLYEQLKDGSSGGGTK